MRIETRGPIDRLLMAMGKVRNPGRAFVGKRFLDELRDSIERAEEARNRMTAAEEAAFNARIDAMLAPYMDEIDATIEARVHLYDITPAKTHRPTDEQLMANPAYQGRLFGLDVFLDESDADRLDVLQWREEDGSDA